ncbi:MAG: hypothetical protein LBC88_01250 [Spirochaetaceae bacterium]|jgi:hypothetical protein|nr:hypothetical protein [Spirochaetaceae bacterium]
MNDLVDEEKYVPTDILAKRGVAAVASLAGGAGLLVLGALPPVMGIAAGAIAVFVGIGAAFSRGNEGGADRKGGVMVTAAGILAILAKLPLSRTLAAPLLGLGAAVLIGFGVWNGIKFLKGLKSRT